MNLEEEEVDVVTVDSDDELTPLVGGMAGVSVTERRSPLILELDSDDDSDVEVVSEVVNRPEVVILEEIPVSAGARQEGADVIEVISDLEDGEADKMEGTSSRASVVNPAAAEDPEPIDLSIETVNLVEDEDEMDIEVEIEVDVVEDLLDDHSVVMRADELAIEDAQVIESPSVSTDAIYCDETLPLFSDTDSDSDMSGETVIFVEPKTVDAEAPSEPESPETPENSGASSPPEPQPSTSQPLPPHLGTFDPATMETRVVYYDNPDFSELTDEERAKMKLALEQRMEEIFPMCNFGPKYKRVYPPFPPSSKKENSLPRQVLKQDPDGVTRRVLFRPQKWRAEDEADVATGKNNFKMPTRPTPHFLELLTGSFAEGVIPERFIRKGGPAPRYRREPPAPSQEDKKEDEEPQPGTSKQAFKELEAGKNAKVWLTNGKMPPFPEFQKIQEKSPELAQRIVEVTASRIAKSVEEKRALAEEQRAAAEKALADKKAAEAAARQKQRDAEAAELMTLGRGRRLRSVPSRYGYEPPAEVEPARTSGRGRGRRSEGRTSEEGDDLETEPSPGSSSSGMTRSTQCPRNTEGAATADRGVVSEVKSGCPLDNDTGWQEGDIWCIERVVASKLEGGQIKYKVKWEGWGEEHNSWVSEEDFGSETSLKFYWKRILKQIKSLNLGIRKPAAAQEPSSSTYFF